VLNEIDVNSGAKEYAGAGGGKNEQNHMALSNESRLSCGALKKDSFPNLRAPPASSAG